MYGIVYSATNIIDGKVYIGATTQDFKARKSKHLDLSKYRNPAGKLARAIKKHGEENFDWKVLKKCKDNNDLHESEIFFIQKFDSRNPIFGYNTMAGGIKKKKCKNTTKVFSILLPPEVYNELREAAESEGFTRALMARLAIIQYLKLRKEKS